MMSDLGDNLVRMPLHCESIITGKNRHLQDIGQMIMLCGFRDMSPPDLETRQLHEQPLSCRSKRLTVFLIVAIVYQILKVWALSTRRG